MIHRSTGAHVFQNKQLSVTFTVSLSVPDQAKIASGIVAAASHMTLWSE